MGSVKNFHHPGDLDPYPANNALNSYTLIREEPDIRLFAVERVVESRPLVRG